MMRRIAFAAAMLSAAAALAASAAWAHNSPPVVLISERTAVRSLLASADKLFVREVRLAAGDAPHLFYIGRDRDGKLLGSAVIMTEPTRDGPIRIAVGISPDGKVKEVQLVQVSEEIYAHMKPLMDRNFTARYAGLGPGANSAAAETSAAGANAMQQHYEDLVSRMVERALVLYDVSIRKGASPS
ncbi:MAG TPA: hypothetical protein VFZ81_07290 [Burkholderiales bacterium]